MISFDENTTPPTISCFGIAGAQASAGIEEGQVRHRRMRRRKPDIVPPGNAILRKHHGGVLAEQRLQTGRMLGRPVAFSVLITTSCGPARPGRSMRFTLP